MPGNGKKSDDNTFCCSKWSVFPPNQSILPSALCWSCSYHRNYVFCSSSADPSLILFYRLEPLGDWCWTFLSLSSPSRDKLFPWFWTPVIHIQGLSNLHPCLNSFRPSTLYIQLPTWHIYCTIWLTCPKLNSWYCSLLPKAVKWTNGTTTTTKNRRQELLLCFLHWAKQHLYALVLKAKT